MIALSGFALAVLLVVLRLIFGSIWAGGGVFTLFALLFMFIGAQFVGMGLLGEYIGRIYNDVRARPRYFIHKIITAQTIKNPQGKKIMKAIVFAYHDIGCVGLRALIDTGYNIQAIFTHTDDPLENRYFSSVAHLATEMGLTVFAPEEVNHPLWVDRIRAFEPDYFFFFLLSTFIKTGHFYPLHLKVLLTYMVLYCHVIVVVLQ